MDVIIIFNGLGNQMSQYAFFQRKNFFNTSRFIFSKKSNNVHNGYELDNVFRIKYHDSLINKALYLIFSIAGYRKFAAISKPASRILKWFGVTIIYENDDYNFKPEYLLPSKGIRFYVGGWHSEKYFIDVQDMVLKTFHFNLENIGKKNLEVLNQIKKSNSVSVHVRRGDFMDPNHYGKLGSVCTLNYFLVAIEKMKTLVENPHFYFFTNDYDWVKSNFIDSNFTLININALGDSWKDMFLISNCSHHINSNGSFSWWSAWLNKKNNPFVIVPKYFLAGQYFEAIYPENWIQLSEY